MAIRVLKSKLSLTQKQQIKHDLLIIEKNAFDKTTIEFEFYIVEPEYIRLPLFYGSQLLESYINDSRTFRPQNKDLVFTGVPRDYQVPVIEKAKKYLDETGTVLLNLFTSAGKTFCVCNIAITKIKLLTLVIFNIDILIESWVSTFKNFCPGVKVWVVGTKAQETTRKKKGYPYNATPENCDVIICMNRRVDKIAPHILDQVGCVIIDEVHKLCTESTVSAWLATQPKYFICLSASPIRPDGLDKMMYAVIGENEIYLGNTKEFTATRIITKFSPPMLKNYTTNKLDWGAIVKWLAVKEERNKVIFDLIMSNLDKKICLLSKLVDHCTVIYNMLIERQVKTALLVRNAKEYEDSNVLIGTFQKIGTGFDELYTAKNFQGQPINLLILAFTVKSKTLTKQSIGRMLRSMAPHLIVITDKNRVINKHFELIKKFCLTNGCTKFDQIYV